MQMNRELVEEGKEWVNGGCCLSDDSSFYGDEDEKTELEARSSSFDPKDYWAYHDKQVNTLVNATRKLTGTQHISEEILFNQFEGVDNGRQLHETVEEFVRRCPPGRYGSNDGWIWCSNPHPPPGKRKQRKAESDVAGFMREGFPLLEGYMCKLVALKAQNRSLPETAIKHRMYPERVLLQANIVKMAKGHNVTSGKWMLFPTLDDAPRIWKLVCQALITARLGSCAKIASSPGRGGMLLICIYTDDFTDMDDVQRVIEELANMGFVSRGTEKSIFKTIYYKCDAYTYLEIESSNPYGLKASLYNSRDILSGSYKALVTSALAAVEPSVQKKLDIGLKAHTHR